MKVKYLVTILVLSALTALSGCRTNPIQNVNDQTIVMNKADATEADVKQAIINAGASLGWIMKANQPGHILGILRIRAHEAQVDIDYNTKNYSIKYKDSINLKYDASGEVPTIHSNYTSWVQNLDRAIQSQLTAI